MISRSLSVADNWIDEDVISRRRVHGIAHNVLSTSQNKKTESNKTDNDVTCGIRIDEVEKTPR